jgi:hypothetical protein
MNNKSSRPKKNPASSKKINAPPPSPPPLISRSGSINSSSAPSMMSSVISGFGHGVGMNVANRIIGNLFPGDKQMINEDCSDIKKSMDKCYKSIDAVDCYEIVKVYSDCIKKV